jgi:hypothetical protein
MIQQQVKSGNIGTLPIRHDPKGHIPERHYLNLLVAFKSFVTITQNNGGVHKCRHKPLVMRLSKVIKMRDWTQSQEKHFLQRVLKDSIANLDATKATNSEDHRICWTTYGDLFLWFDNWEAELVVQGFAHHGQLTNKISLPPDQLKNILNFDETCLSLNGSTIKRGSHPEVILYDQRFPMVG